MDGETQTLSPETTRWLEDRRQPGNWLAIRPDDEIPADVPGWDRTILHMFQIAFAPEIFRRLASGALDDTFVLFSAQLIQPEEGGQRIRFNHEVRGIPLVRLSRPVEKGESVLTSDMRDLVSFDVEEDELDSGHFTMFWHGSGWSISFDFRSGRAKSAQMIESSRQFLAAAQFSAGSGHAGPCVDNLFSACELLSKAHLILHQSRASQAKSHKAVSTALNLWGRLGNVDGEFLNLFNRMSNSRSVARYDAASEVALPSAEDFAVIERELQQLEAAVAHRTKERVLPLIEEEESEPVVGGGQI